MEELQIIKWTAVTNIDVMEDDNIITLHRELEFITEEEVDDFIRYTKDNTGVEYEKIPVWG